MNHWIILPILLPAVMAPILVLAARHDLVLARVLSMAAAVLMLVLAAALLVSASVQPPQMYALGDWPAPFGIVLVLDRLSALMLVLAALLSLIVLLYALGGWDGWGRHFHALWQFQLMGINGAFLTGDFFNLFVFFEVLLIASYGLMVHGGGALRVRAGVQYVVVNLVGSSLFLIAVGLIYSVTGTLNMADLAGRVVEVVDGDRAILHTGALLLLLVFGIKAALVPVHFWLPGTYGNAAAPVAALFAIMTKVGAYSILRLFPLAFGEGAGLSAGLAVPWLLPAALLTLALGMTGVLAARSLTQLASFAVIGSMGTLMTAVGLFSPQATSAALYYLLHSTLAAAALFLIAGEVSVRRACGDRLSPGASFADRGLLAAFFFVAAIALCGMPPLSGFLGKLMILDSARGGANAVWIWAVILVSSLLCIIGFGRAGSTVFWKSDPAAQPLAVDVSGSRPRSVLPLVSIGTLLAALVLLTAFAGPLMGWIEQAATQIYQPERYIDAVMGEAGGYE
ncbi:monovalent cation/H+ antiporter subunit D [Azoarcus communis]|uniref:monovalent cation/H+ antiporter subunit D n=1 Tax=Parazoarcus communis TaxID=41977 RepID=UPI0014597818|nr:monovalent cation/H+ antiporter subunit D [Parazoarcus communis]NMG48917.1 monovalent cation/H+ antiporter subunit D [Parazoarcus communis]